MELSEDALTATYTSSLNNEIGIYVVDEQTKYFTYTNEGGEFGIFQIKTKYDENFCPIERVNGRLNDVEPPNKNINECDVQGRLISSTSILGDGYTSVRYFDWSNDGKSMQETYVDVLTGGDVVDNWVYDKYQNLLINRTQYAKEIIAYIYDERHSWISKTAKVADDVGKVIRNDTVIRKFTYY